MVKLQVGIHIPTRAGVLPARGRFVNRPYE